MASYASNKKPPYGNFLVLHPDGTPMFRCAVKKVRFYLKNKLASVVDATTIRLNFTPNGPGHAGDPYHLAQKENRCVVCGGNQKLTRHHIVPYCYRRQLPAAIKVRSSHDVVLLCWPCHKTYENRAQPLKAKLGEAVGVPPEGVGIVFFPKSIRARAAANAILRFSTQMPPERLEALYQKVEDAIGRSPSFQDLIDVMNLPGCDTSNRTSHGEAVVAAITDLQAFVNRWRDHFLAAMRPAFMPDGWDPRRPLDVGGHRAQG